VIELHVAAVTPALAPEPRVPAAAQPAQSPALAVGVPRPVQDHQVEPTRTIPAQGDVPQRASSDVGTAIGVVGGAEGVFTTEGPPLPQQDPPALVSQPDVFVAVERMPELIGGLRSIQPIYPDMERRVGIEGRVFVQFVVNEDGAVSDIVVLRGVNAGLDRAAVEAVQRARFRPGIQAGRSVRVRMSLPINFRLN
jgi:TonB family protein